MKIAVCGKGGVGKTFIAGSLAEQFVLAGHPVIAIDADSSPNLALTLGLSAEQAKAIIPIAENEEWSGSRPARIIPGLQALVHR